jgi:uncharacterized membrane protein
VTWTDDGAAESRREQSRLALAWRRVRTPAVGVAAGLVAGMGSYMSTRTAIVPDHGLPLLPGAAWYPLVMVGLAGAYVYLLTPDSRESIVAALVGAMTAVATLVAAAIAPLWVLYPPAARDVLIRTKLHDAVPGLLIGIVIVYFAGYLTTVLVLGYLDV